MSQPLASLSAGLVGRRRPSKTNPLVFVPPIPAAKKRASLKPVPLIGPSLKTEVPKVIKKTPQKVRVAKTLRLNPDLNKELLEAAGSKGCSQQSIMENALRHALHCSGPENDKISKAS